MMSTPTMSTTPRERRLTIARHEAGHAAMAFVLGIPLYGVEVEASCGATWMDYGLSPETFAQAYAQEARKAVERVVHVLAILHAGPYCELIAGMHGGLPRGQDADDVRAWQAAITQTLGAEWYGRILASSLGGLRGWYTYPRVQAAIAALAYGLAEHPGISVDALSTLVAQAGMQTVPRPYFAPVVSPVVYMPGFSQRAVPSVRRPASPEMDLSKFARSDAGTIRPMTPREWAYLQKHGVQAILPYINDGELAQLNQYMEATIALQEAQRARQG